MRLPMQTMFGLLLGASSVACSGQANDDAFSRFKGDPYLGPVTVRILQPGAAAKAGSDDSGTGTAQFIDDGHGGGRLIVTGSIAAEADAGFVLDGSYVADGWRSRESDVIVNIGADGKISGGGVDPPNSLAFDGRVSEKTLALEVVLEQQAAGANGFPVGTRFVFDYRLARDSANGAEQVAAGDEEDPDGPCKRIEWYMKSVVNFSGGPMGQVRVPRCIQ